MQIHHVTGSSLTDALLRARRAFGEEALVISQEVVAGGGVTLSVARRRVSPSVQAAPERGDTLVAPRAALSPRLHEMARALRRTGTSDAMIQRIVAQVEPLLTSDTHVFDLAAEAIGSFVPIAHLPRLRTATRVLAFAGATGVGKTTSLVKLAARLAQAGRRVELATIDSRNVGAVEQLRAYSKLLAMPLTVVSAGARLNPGLFAAPSVDAILVDTSGTPAIDAEGLTLLRDSLASVPVAFDTYAVLSASNSKSALETSARALAVLAPTGFIVTKLDETTEPAVVLEHGLAAGWPLAFLSDGPDIARHFQRGGPERVADLFLRGKLS